MLQNMVKVLSITIAMLIAIKSSANPQNDGVIFGSTNAPVEVIEYMSLTCSHCADFHNETLPYIIENYIKTSKVKLIIRDFPLDGVAYRASMISHCIANGNNEKYFGFVKFLFEQQKSLISAKDPIEQLQKISAIAGIDKNEFNKCLGNKELGNKVLMSRKIGEEQFNINSTPTLIINGKKFSGGLDEENFKKIVDKLIKK